MGHAKFGGVLVGGREGARGLRVFPEPQRPPVITKIRGKISCRRNPLNFFLSLRQNMSDKREKKRKLYSTDGNERPAKKRQNAPSPAVKVKFLRNNTGLSPIVGSALKDSDKILNMF